jgi:Tfp pilus assembly protein PilF
VNANRDSPTPERSRVSNAIQASRLLLVTIVFVLIPAASTSECQNSKADSNLETSETPVQQAAASLEAGDLRKNEDLLKQAAHKDPNNPKVWRDLCRAYQHTEDLNRAMKAGRHALSLDQSWSTHSGLAMVYRKKNNYRKAADELEKAIADTDLSPDSALREILLDEYVWALFHSNQYERAIPAAKRLVEVSWELTLQDAYRTLAIAYMKTGQREKAQEAIRSGYGPDCFLQIADKPEDSGVGCKHGLPEGWIPFR